MRTIEVLFSIFFGLWGFWGQSLGANFPVALSNHASCRPWLLCGSTHYFPEGFIHLKSCWAQDAWLQWSHANWYFHFDISRWLSMFYYWLHNFPISGSFKLPTLFPTSQICCVFLQLFFPLIFGRSNFCRKKYIMPKSNQTSAFSPVLALNSKNEHYPFKDKTFSYLHKKWTTIVAAGLTHVSLFLGLWMLHSKESRLDREPFPFRCRLLFSISSKR